MTRVVKEIHHSESLTYRIDSGLRLPMKAVTVTPDATEEENLESSPSWSTPEKPLSRKMMKTPGITIPTPMGFYQNNENSEDFVDDTAFLPDDFKLMSMHKENVRFTSMQVQEMVDSAVERAREEWSETTKIELEKENKRVIEQIRKESEEQLQEHGIVWEEDHRFDIQRLKTEMETQSHQQQLRFDKQMEEVRSEHANALQEVHEKIENITQETEMMRAVTLETDATNAKLREKLMELETSLSDVQLEHCNEVERMKKAHNKDLEEMKRTYSSSMEKELGARAEMVLEHNKSVEHLQHKIQNQHHLHETSIIALMDEHEKATDALKRQIEIQEVVNMDASKIIDSYEKQILSLVQEHEITLQSIRHDMTSKYDEEILVLKSEFGQSQEAAEKQIEQLHMELSLLVDKFDVARKDEAEAKTVLLQRIELKEKEKNAQIEENLAKFEVERRSLIDRVETARAGENNLVAQIAALKDEIRRLEGDIVLLAATARDAQTLVDAERDAAKKCAEDVVTKHQKELVRLNTDLEREHHAELTLMENRFNDALAAKLSQSDREKELLTEELLNLQESCKKDSENFALRVKMVREEYTAQIDEMLSQLDLVEAEHNQRNTTMQKSVIEKDAIISALGSQLAEAQHRRSQLEAENKKNAQALKAAEENLRLSQNSVAEVEAFGEELRVEHAVAIEEQRRLGRAQCDQVRDETIAAAEEQFRKANEHYMSLKQEYDSSIVKIGKLEKELRSVRREFENAKSEGVAREAVMASELAQSKAGKCGSLTHHGADAASNEHAPI